MEILVVIVRYNLPLHLSQTVQGLEKAFQDDPELLNAMEVLIWDNSRETLADPTLNFRAEYRSSTRNEGVSGAYNAAIDIALKKNLRWMLLLDQDTSVTAHFLAAMLRHARQLDSQKEIAAIAPTVHVGEFVVSPRRTRFNSNSPYEGPGGLAEGEPFAINSGCLMRVEALEAIGGFSLDFWLDYSDMYVFHQFFLHGFKVWRATDAELQHEMTIMDYDNLMAPWRYKNFIEAEGAFIDLYKGRMENAMQLARLVFRAVRQRLRYRNPEFSRITWSHLRHRLGVGKQHRLELWRHAQKLR